jgi:hypothetical protein
MNDTIEGVNTVLHGTGHNFPGRHHGHISYDDDVCVLFLASPLQSFYKHFLQI